MATELNKTASDGGGNGATIKVINTKLEIWVKKLRKRLESWQLGTLMSELLGS